jgi:hypothetical protein
MMSSLNCATLMKARMKLNLIIRILTIGNLRHFLRNLESPWMIGLLYLSLLSVAYVFCGPLAYSDYERAKQLLYALDDHV